MLSRKNEEETLSKRKTKPVDGNSAPPDPAPLATAGIRGEQQTNLSNFTTTKKDLSAEPT
jgi:hypothetical protein